MEKLISVKLGLSAVLAAASILLAPQTHAQAETESREASSAHRELLGRSFKLLRANIKVNRVTIASQKKLAKAYAQTQGEPRELISSALGEIMAMPRLNAICNAEQMKNNIAYRGTSMMYDSIGFVFKPSREIHCDQLSIKELEMKALELTDKTMKLAVTLDHVTTRTANCEIESVDGMWNLWKDVSIHCTFADGEGTFTLDID
jgi:hypothetical protein